MSSSTCRITIVGAGIIGLTTACTILKEYAGNEHLRLTILAEKFSPDTTGDISAGYWEPYGLEAIDERTLRWAGYTYDIFMSEFYSTKAARAGIIKAPSYTIRSTTSDVADPGYSTLVRHFRRLDQHELGMFEHLDAKSGFVMSSVIVEMTKYLPLLRSYLAQDSRVEFIQRRIGSISELKGTADVVINCTGLASRHLANDPKVRPARGQIIRVYAPWIKSVYQLDLNDGHPYIIPQGDTVVLGGTFQLDDWDETVRQEDTDSILRLCRKCLPALDDIQHARVQVGLRPFRDGGVRLEHERTTDGIDLVHCYGHSGAGVTLSWGCAKDVVDIVRGLLPSHSKQKNRRAEHEQLWRLTPGRETLAVRAKL